MTTPRSRLQSCGIKVSGASEMAGGRLVFKRQRFPDARDYLRSPCRYGLHHGSAQRASKLPANAVCTSTAALFGYCRPQRHGKENDASWKQTDPHPSRPPAAIANQTRGPVISAPPPDGHGAGLAAGRHHLGCFTKRRARSFRLVSTCRRTVIDSTTGEECGCFPNGRWPAGGRWEHALATQGLSRDTHVIGISESRLGSKITRMTIRIPVVGGGLKQVAVRRVHSAPYALATTRLFQVSIVSPFLDELGGS